MRALIVVLLLGSAGPASAQPIEPPPEAEEGADYTAEPADSLAEGQVELGMGASGRAGSGPVRRRRVRFTGDEMSGTVREGRDDPLAGSTVAGRGRRGTFTVGRLAPRWGRGLLMGAAGEPWQRDATDRGSRAAYRGRSGEGVIARPGRDERFELLYGRFGRQRLAGAHARRGGLSLGALSDGRVGHQASLAVARGSGESELAWDRAGRWRAEGLLERPLGRSPGVGPATGGWRATLRARGGAGGFASLAERGRPGPSQAVAVMLEGPLRATRASLFSALWRFRPGVAGARAGLAVERPLAHHGALALGFEEQRGSRRDRGGSVPLASLGATDSGLRQGWWGEWWSGAGEMALGLRHESWGERPWGRGVVRSVTSARLAARGPAGLRLGVTHSIFQVKRGESLYLPEAESDRLVLRAISGVGARTRVEAHAPFAGGTLRGTLSLATAPERRVRPQWTLDWTRRARLRRAASPG